ncbi:2-oxoacid:acceptor oxidoreductase, gamma subunit, pyruvate/2-ketoisovalerate family [Aciduliprofundum sp. MAR08-339]|uniref:pyruvate ferredoxin oxidoreductase subunit gamma n=1 Tax=Aciduliprofundum sp. (strain MAR08-339) TaxID=673860 RepID=UPI0002A4B823|nr:2-oxoacid:acceptor oxidoreductase, gamma subunit, pyruvate/2-ketoisovalerate family [Aciduliprofundum sp. MAR08-339]
MIEIRFHGRGGQGSVIASKILAKAFFMEGKYVSSFPYFGVERRGAPVTAFTRVDDKPIRAKYQIYDPDYVIVLDPSLIKAVDVLRGIKEDGWVLVNTMKSPKELKKMLDFPKVATVDATTIAIRHRLGSQAAPIVNTAILGAFARISGLVKIETVMDAIREGAPVKKEDNAQAAKEAYEHTNLGGD